MQHDVKMRVLGTHTHNSYCLLMYAGCPGVKFSRVFELRHELAHFPQFKKPHWLELFRNSEWVAKLAYVVDIFDILNGFVSMQEKMTLCFTITDKIDGMKRKLHVCFDMFHKLSATISETDSGIETTSGSWSRVS